MSRTRFWDWRWILAVCFVSMGVAILWQGPEIIQQARAQSPPTTVTPDCYGQSMPTDPGTWFCCPDSMGWIDTTAQCCASLSSSSPDDPEDPETDSDWNPDL